MLVCFVFRNKSLMHRKQSTDLIPADTELEKTLRSLRKIKKAENSTMADERQKQNDEHREAVRRPLVTDTMEDFWRLIIQDEYSAIRQPAVEANNFELKSALITMVQRVKLGRPQIFDKLLSTQGSYSPQKKNSRSIKSLNIRTRNQKSKARTK